MSDTGESTSDAAGRNGDWAKQAADTVVDVVGKVRDNTTARVILLGKALVYGLVAAILGIVGLILTLVVVLRFVDNYLPGEVWSAYLLLGSLFTLVGAFLWIKRGAIETS